MIDLSDAYYTLISGRSKNEKIALSQIYKSFEKNYNLYYFLPKDSDFIKDCFQEFILKIIQNRQKLLCIYKKASKCFVKYINEMRKNLLLDIIRKNKFDSRNLSLSELKSKDDKINKDNDINFYKINNSKDIEYDQDYLSFIIFDEASRLKSLVTSELSDLEILFLYYICNKECQKNIKLKYLNNMSEDAIYKRVERCKKKFAEIVNKHSLCIESVDLFLKIHLPNEFEKRFMNESN